MTRPHVRPEARRRSGPGCGWDRHIEHLVAGYYDLWSVAAHEFGHAWGLVDLYGPYTHDQMMYGGPALTNDIEPRYLGFGDYNAARHIYP